MDCRHVLHLPTRSDSALNLKNKKTGKDTLSSSQSKEIVYVFSNGMSVPKDVKIGIQDNNYIEIKSGLSLNDEVIIAPYSVISKKLKDKTKVKKAPKDKLFNSEDH